MNPSELSDLIIQAMLALEAGDKTACEDALSRAKKEVDKAWEQLLAKAS